MAFAALIALEYQHTKPTRSVLRNFTRLSEAVRRGDIETVRSLCSTGYLEKKPLQESTQGGLLELPRGIHRNFRIWRRGNEIWLCPGDRIGPVYRFVADGEEWTFDGLVGLLQSGQLILVESPGEDQQLNPVIPTE